MAEQETKTLRKWSQRQFTAKGTLTSSLLPLKPPLSRDSLALRGLTQILCRLASLWSRGAADVLQRHQGSIAENPVTARRRHESEHQSRRVTAENARAATGLGNCRQIAVRDCRQTYLGRGTRSPERLRYRAFKKSGRQDSNLRPSAPKAPALPSCATPRVASTVGQSRRIKLGQRQESS